MVVATFGPTTAWLGRTITFENDAFVLQDHGPISAGDVMRYDQQGQLVWASDGARAWVGARAQAISREAARSSAESILTQRRMRSARRVLAWNAWCFAVLGVVSIWLLAWSHNARPGTLAVPILFCVAPAAVILLSRPARITAVRLWLVATALGDFCWAALLTLVLRDVLDTWSYSTVNTPAFVLSVPLTLALGVLGVLSVRGALDARRSRKMSLRPGAPAAGRYALEPAHSCAETFTVREVGSSVAIAEGVGPAGLAEGPGPTAGLAGSAPGIVAGGARPRSPRRRGYLTAAVVAVVVALIAAVALVPAGHAGTDISQNWAGYVAFGQQFTSVTATWIQPQLRGKGTGAQRVGIWVGLDGCYRVSSTVEQTGIDAVCGQGSDSGPSCFAWHEMFPKPLVPITTAQVEGVGSEDLVVHAGDTITATVTSLGDQRFRLTLADDTQGKSFSIIETSNAARCDSAEIIVEAQEHVWGFADFDPVHFTDCAVDGRPLAAFDCKTPNIAMNGGRRMTSTSALGADGASFTVTRR